MSRRRFLEQVGAGAGAIAALAVSGRARVSAETPSSYPEWIPASNKPPRRGGALTRASAWDPPVLDPRLTQSVGLFQFAALVGSRLVRYVFPDEATGAGDLALKGDLAESWQSSPDFRVWTFSSSSRTSRRTSTSTSRSRSSTTRRIAADSSTTSGTGEFDQVWRMWMLYDNGFVTWQPHVRNAASAALRRTDGYGASSIARVWLDA